MSKLCRECRNFPGLGKQCGLSQKLMATANNPACSMYTSKSDVEFIRNDEPLFPSVGNAASSEVETTNIEIVKKDPSGNQQVICMQPKGTQEAINVVMAVNTLQSVDKENCPYSYRYV